MYVWGVLCMPQNLYVEVRGILGVSSCLYHVLKQGPASAATSLTSD